MASRSSSVLIVDDRPEGLFSVEAVLRASQADHPYNIFQASSGIEAIEHVKQNDFAVILLDVQMPGMDGFETAAEIRKLNFHVPIIFITAISHDELHVFKGYDSGAVDYLFKPLNATVLRSKINVFIDLFEKNQVVMEQAKKLQEREKREHERQYKNLADAIPHLVFKTDIDGVASYFNQGWGLYTNLSDEQSYGLGWQSVFHSEDLISFLRQWRQAKQDETSFETEIRLMRSSDDTQRWHLIRGVPQSDSNGLVDSWLFSCTDVHLTKESVSKLEQRTNDLERSNRDLEQFAYVASHDLQEPLRKVTSYVDLLLIHTNGQLNDNAKKCLDPIVNGIKRMHQLISDLLNYSRVIKENANTVEVVDIEHEATDALEALSRENDFEISFDSLAKVKGNTAQIRQLFQNLLSNAVKFHGNAPLRIHIGMKKEAGESIFYVKDNGIGIPEEFQEKIFVIFQRLHNRTRYPGTGIGLSICKKIVENHRGRIWVESEEGRGATFYFTLPVWEEAVVA